MAKHAALPNLGAGDQPTTVTIPAGYSALIIRSDDAEAEVIAVQDLLPRD